MEGEEVEDSKNGWQGGRVVVVRLRKSWGWWGYVDGEVGAEVGEGGHEG